MDCHTLAPGWPTDEDVREPVKDLLTENGTDVPYAFIPQDLDEPIDSVHRPTASSQLLPFRPIAAAHSGIRQLEAFRNAKVHKKVKKPRASPCKYDVEDWNKVKTNIHNLYHNERLALNDVVDIMGDVHDFHAADSTYSKWLKEWGMGKNTTQGEAPVCNLCGTTIPNSDRYRKQVTPPYRARKLMLLGGKAAISRSIPHADSGGILGYLEIMLGAISTSTDRLFASYGPTRWHAVDTEFIAPTNTLNDANFWQLILDQLSNIQHLVKANLWYLVYESLDKLLRFESIEKNAGLHFLVIIWRICLLLTKIKIPGMDHHAQIRQKWEQPQLETHKIRGQRQETQPHRKLPRARVRRLSSNSRQRPADEAQRPSHPITGRRQTNKSSLSNFALVGVFLHRLYLRLPGNSPMRRIAMALSYAFVTVRERPDFRIVLRDGFRRTIECLTPWAGEHHPVLLSMKSDFTKHWKLAGPDAEASEVSRHHQQSLACQDPWHSRIFQLYESSRAAFKGKDDTKETADNIFRLFVLSSVACGQSIQPGKEQAVLDSSNLPLFEHEEGRCLTWGLYPKALGFSTDALAKIRLGKYHRKRQDKGHIKPSRARYQAENKGEIFHDDRNDKDVIEKRKKTLSIVLTTIDTLRNGDLECLNAAWSLSKSLVNWYKGSWNDREKALGQKKISSDIVAEINRARAGGSRRVELVKGQGSRNNSTRRKNDALRERIILDLAW